MQEVMEVMGRGVFKELNEKYGLLCKEREREGWTAIKWDARSI
jgi:hypothetical protein